MDAAIAQYRPNSNPRFLGVGSYGIVYIVYSLDKVVVVKVSRGNRGSEQEFNTEQDFVKGLARESPYLLPYFYVVPCATFMLRAQTDLRMVIFSKDYQYDPDIGSRWMGQLCGGAAYLGEQEMAHCDLRPDNILLDYNNNVRLFDFGSSLPVGKIIPAGTEPFARLLSKEDGKDSGTYGRAGAHTENFAIGSIYYCITRGHRPHQSEKDTRTLMEMYKAKKFAPLTNSTEDQIIHGCWHGHYQSVVELEQVFRDMKDGTEWYYFAMEPDDLIRTCRQECVEWVNGGGLDTLRKTPTR